MMTANDDEDYRASFPEITLPLTGNVPQSCGCKPSTTEIDRRLGFIGDAWSSVEGLSQRRRLPNNPVLPTEVARAWRLWLAGHHAFFILYGLLAEAYQQMIAARDRSDDPSLAKWTRRSVALNKGAGALLLVGIDFEPTMDIYQQAIRAEMPEAFSGYWLREAIVVGESRRAWTAQSAMRPAVIDAKKFELEGRGIYDRYHRDVMRRSVSDGRSLANKYRHTNGSQHQITEDEFCRYDQWFRIRRTALSRIGFLMSASRAVRLAAESVVSGSRLEDGAVRDLSAGLEAALCITAEWLGPLPETSAHQSKSSRGE